MAKAKRGKQQRRGLVVEVIERRTYKVPAEFAAEVREALADDGSVRFELFDELLSDVERGADNPWLEEVQTLDAREVK